MGTQLICVSRFYLATLQNFLFILLLYLQMFVRGFTGDTCTICNLKFVPPFSTIVSVLNRSVDMCTLVLIFSFK